jgi:nucleoside-diphosphate-sugar epimerase
MRIFLTGHTGFIGSVAVGVFKQAEHTVVGLDAGYFPFVEAGATAPDVSIQADLRHITPTMLEGVDTVVHLACLANDPMCELNPTLTDEINHRASVQLAQLAKQAGVGRFVFASSCSIYGAADVSKSLDETAPLNPVSAYAISKIKAEEGLMALADATFSPTFMRNATAYGISPCTRMDLVVNNLTASGFTTGEIKVMSDGTPWRPLAHIEDIAAAALALAEAPRAAVHGEAFNIGRTDGNYQVRQVAQLVAAQLPGATLNITGETGGDPRSYQVNFDKIQRHVPAFKPQWTVEKGIAQIKHWLENGGLHQHEFTDRRFMRLKQIKHLLATGEADANLLMQNFNQAAA